MKKDETTSNEVWVSESNEHMDNEELLRELNEKTKLSERQAFALMIKEIYGLSNEGLAEALDVSSVASAVSYVSKARNKFDEVDERIDELEREIERWENTRELENIIREVRANEDGIFDIVYAFQEMVAERFKSKTQKYHVAYVDDDGKEEVTVTEVHPKTADIDDILHYEEIESVEELFG
jgi:superfamily I DNA/RNA helicase